jgi:hypothetical protein
MSILSRVRFLAFLVMLAGVSAPTPVNALEPPACPVYNCNDCPNPGLQVYWGDYDGDCCGCSFMTYCMYDGGEYNMCYCENAC